MKDILRGGLALLMSVVMTLSLFVGYLPTEAFAEKTKEVASDGFRPEVAEPEPDASEPPEPTQPPEPPEPTITITSDRANNTLEYIGDTLTLTATLVNAGGVDPAKLVTEWSSSNEAAATVYNGVVTAQNFKPTMNDLERRVTITVTMKELSEGDTEEKVYTGSCEVIVSYFVQPIFYYALIPGHSEDTVGGNGDKDWFGIGEKWIAGAPRATGVSRDVSIQYEDLGVRKDLYPQITHNNVTYTYGSTEGNGYTLDPFRLVSDHRANAGNNGYNQYDGSQDPEWTYHLDHRMNFTEPGDWCNVHFMVRDPGAESFALDEGSRRTVKKDTAESSIQKPGMGQKTKDGIVYTFDGWYTDQNFTYLENFQGTITDNTWYYGRYKPTQAKYMVRFFYDNSEDQAKAETLTGTIGTTISSDDQAIAALIKKNTISGYRFASATPSITLTEGATKEIRVYYTKRNFVVTYEVDGGPPGLSAPQGDSYMFEQTVPAAPEIKEEGYTFSGWTTDDIPGKTKVTPGTTFAMPGNDVTLVGTLRPRNDTPYTVEHYQQNPNDNDYTLKETENDHTGKTGDTAKAGAKHYPGFKLNPDATNAKPSGTITGDGKLVLRLYYDRRTFPVTYKATYPDNTPSYSQTTQFKWGQTVNIDGKLTKTGYTFTGWTTDDSIEVKGTAADGDTGYGAGNSFVMPQDEVTFTGSFTANPFSYTVNYYLVGTGVNGVPAIKAAASESGPLTDFGKKETVPAKKIDGYTLAGPDHQTLTIGAEQDKNVVTFYYYKNVTVTAENAAKVYGEADPEFTAKVDGLLTADQNDPKYTFTRKSGDTVGTYDITPSVNSLKSYYKIVKQTSGTLTITRRPVQLNGETKPLPYDGTTHILTGVTPSTVEGEPISGLVSGHTVKCSSYKAEGTDIGEYPGSFAAKDAKIFNGKDDVTKNYDIRYSEGSLTIEKREITIRPKLVSVTYDGAAHQATDFEYVGTGRPLGTDTLTVSAYTGQSVTDAGEYEAVSEIGSYTITNQKGEDAAKNYEVKTEKGDIVIAKRNVTLRSNDASKTYDGAELKNESVTVSGDGFVKGQEPTYSFTGSQKNVGSSANSFDYTLAAEYAKNYNITTKVGTLTVTQAELTIVADSSSKRFDGRPLRDGGVSITLAGKTQAVETNGSYTRVNLLGSDSCEIIALGEQTNTGSSPNNVDIRWSEETAKNYKFAWTPGYLTVTAGNEIVVTTTGGVFTYDGQPHGADVTVTNLPAGYTVQTATSSATATNVIDGTVVAACDNLVIRNEQQEDVTSELDISYTNGKITINPAPLYITTQSATKEYDGEPLYAGATVEGLVNNETVSVTAMGSQTEIGTSQNGYHVAWVGTAKVYNYEVVESLGTLTVTAEGVPPVPPMQGEDDNPPEVRVVETMLLEDEIVPLAGGMERCCILHFLLALAALIVVLVSGHDTKKLQKKIAELKQESSPQDGEDDGKDDN